MWRSQPQAQNGTTSDQATKANGSVTVGSKASISADVRSIAQSNNQFAFDLFQKLREQEGNLFFSPASISTGLAMTYGGAAGETKKQMANVLHFELPESRLQAGFGTLNTILNTKSPSYQLKVANRLWLQSGFRFEASFLKSTLEHYGVEPAKVDFAEPESARRTINEWVASQTDGKISDLLSAGVLQDKTRFVLTNAIYFKGTWRYRFAKADTRKAPFQIAKDRQIQVSMMQQTGALRYAQVEDAQLLELPYVGEHLSMVILLPTRLDGLAALEKELVANDALKWISSLHDEDEVEVYVPKFTFTLQMGLKDKLSSLGMSLAFSDQAEFSGISLEKQQKLFDVIHQAFVDVNEDGTEAAAATGHIGGDAPGPVPRTVIFRADHPFLFLIKDQRTGAILFLGRIVDPNA
jgi:serpin B